MYDLLTARESIVKALSLSLKVQPDKLEARVASMAEEQRKLSTEVERLKVRPALQPRARRAHAAVDAPRPRRRCWQSPRARRSSPLRCACRMAR
jgi:cell division protein FtsB